MKPRKPFLMNLCYICNLSIIIFWIYTTPGFSVQIKLKRKAFKVHVFVQFYFNDTTIRFKLIEWLKSFFLIYMFSWVISEIICLTHFLNNLRIKLWVHSVFIRIYLLLFDFIWFHFLLLDLIRLWIDDNLLWVAKVF